jgi:hypothetical protein
VRQWTTEVVKQWVSILCPHGGIMRGSKLYGGKNNVEMLDIRKHVGSLLLLKCLDDWLLQPYLKHRFRLLGTIIQRAFFRCQ